MKKIQLSLAGLLLLFCVPAVHADAVQTAKEWGNEVKETFKALGKGIQAANREKTVAQELNKLATNISSNSTALSGRIDCMAKCPGVKNANDIIRDLRQTLEIVREILPERIAKELTNMANAVNPMLEQFKAAALEQLKKPVQPGKATKLEERAGEFLSTSKDVRKQQEKEAQKWLFPWEK